MSKQVTANSKSRRVHTSGVSNTDKAIWDDTKVKVSDSGTTGKSKQLDSWSRPLPSQVLTFQRGLARAVMEQIPDEREQVEALAEALSMMGLLDRFYKMKPSD